MYTSKIDEERFRVLFPEGKKSGRPTASIRVLVSMSWLKEGFGCSDEELFEKCEFDLLTRKSLGLELISDVAPSLDTYYLFRRRICEYYEKTGIDLMQECFESVTGGLVKQLKISGKCIRMDSKLIGSNIARQSRYELISTTLQKFLKSVEVCSLKSEFQGLAKAYLGEDPSKTVYRSDADTLQSHLAQIGSFIHQLLSGYEDNDPRCALLRRVFDEQYTVKTARPCFATRRQLRQTAYRTPTTPMPPIATRMTRRYRDM